MLGDYETKLVGNQNGSGGKMQASCQHACPTGRGGRRETQPERRRQHKTSWVNTDDGREMRTFQGLARPSICQESLIAVPCGDLSVPTPGNPTSRLPAQVLHPPGTVSRWVERAMTRSLAAGPLAPRCGWDIKTRAPHPTGWARFPRLGSEGWTEWGPAPP